MNPHQSHILSIIDLASNILTGKETEIIFLPSNNYLPADLIKSNTNPSYAFISSLLKHSIPPSLYLLYPGTLSSNFLPLNVQQLFFNYCIIYNYSSNDFIGILTTDYLIELDNSLTID